MRVERLATRGFRNLAPFELHLDARFVVFRGDNAQGKTNTLEALWLAATLRGLRARQHRELVGWDHDEATVVVDVRHQGLVHRHRVDIGGGQRKISLDGSPPAELSDYFASIRAIAFTPDDAGIVAGEPGRRRSWIDRAAFTATPSHLELVRTYKRVLQQKSALLRAGSVDVGVLDALDHSLALHGARLAHRRAAVIDELLPYIQELYRGISGGDEVLIKYRTTARGQSEADRQEALLERLVEVRPRELLRQTTLAGPQLDDIDLVSEGRSARNTASRGQVRSLVLALKLGELVAARARGQTPLFLLDDLSSELDRSRTAQLVERLTALDTQVFITTTDPDHIQGLPLAETRVVTIHGGVLGDTRPQVDPASPAG